MIIRYLYQLLTEYCNVELEQNSSVINVFPNPVSDVLNISYSGVNENNLIVELFDISGKNVLIQNVKSIYKGDVLSVNVNHLNNGIYILKLKSGNKLLSVEKIVK